MSFESEIEKKFDIAEHLDDNTIIYCISHALGRPPARTVARTFRYFDDQNLTFLKNEWTVREVSGRNDARATDVKFESTHEYYHFRIDIKMGSTSNDTRKEMNIWCGRYDENRAENIKNILNYNGVAILDLSEVARVNTLHTKWKIDGIEISFDRFYSKDGTLLFREVELEVIDADKIALQKYIRIVTSGFMSSDLTPTHVQKFQRVVFTLLKESINK